MEPRIVPLKATEKVKPSENKVIALPCLDVN